MSPTSYIINNLICKHYKNNEKKFAIGNVRWVNVLSRCVSMVCGVRQGGVLSSVVFAVYVDDKIMILLKG